MNIDSNVVYYLCVEKFWSISWKALLYSSVHVKVAYVLSQLKMQLKKKINTIVRKLVPKVIRPWRVAVALVVAVRFGTISVRTGFKGGETPPLRLIVTIYKVDITSRAAARVLSMSPSVWARAVNPASNCEGAKYTPRSNIPRWKRPNLTVSD